MAEFIYNNAKNTSIGYITFEFNYNYHPQVFFKDNIDFNFKSYTVNGLLNKLRKSINIGQ